MAVVNESIKLGSYDNVDDSDDDKPICFKRTSNSSSKQAQLNSAPKKPSSSSLRNDGPVKRPAPSQSSLNGDGSSSQKSKFNSNAKVAKPLSAEPNLARSSVPGHSNNGVAAAGTSKERSHVSKSHEVVDSDDDKPLNSRFKSNSANSEKGAKQESEHKVESNDGDRKVSEKAPIESEAPDDSDDEKPLSFRFASGSTAVRKGSSLVARKAQESPGPSSPPPQKLKATVKQAYDSEDEKPLLSEKGAKQESEHKVGSNDGDRKVSEKAPIKSEAPDDPDDEKPLSFRFASGSAAVRKGSSLVARKARESPGPSSPPQKLKATVKQAYDSEDEKPLLSRLPPKSSGGTSVASKLKENGSNKKESSSDLKSAKSANKRTLGDTSKSSDSSAKKVKTSDASIPAKVKNETTVKKEVKADDDDDIPMAQRMKKSVSLNSQSSVKKVIKKTTTTTFKKDGKKMKKTLNNYKYSKSLIVPPGSGGGQKWTTLEHNGVIFPPPYKSHGVKMLYNGQPVDLTPAQEEVATMFAVMKDTEYATKQKFLDNFWSDWKQILGKNHIIKKFDLCDFTPIYDWHLREKEKKKQMTSEEKKALKEEKLKQEEKYMWAIVDGVKEKIGNFRVEPPGLFRGRGEHPKMGKFKRRIRPKDITINIGKNASVPECPIPGERWKEVKHDNTVTWLAFWNDPINSKEFKYVFLAASSSLKGQNDKEKYEKARLLKDYIDNIRVNYTKDFTSKDATKRQIAVATYLIDKLALRAGNEKDDDEADTVGCCTLKVENVVCVPPNKLQFDFLGKDSIRYFNTVEVELPVYKAVGEFRTAKKSDGKKKADGDDLFDMLDTSKLNAHLKELMPALTAKVFRTYNASITLDAMIHKEIKEGTLPEKIAVYQHANKEVAIICNHQRSVSKSHDAQMSRLNEKIDELKAQREELKVDLSRAKKGKPPLKDGDGKPKKNLSSEAIEKKLSQVDAKIEKMELDKNIKEDLKTVALGTSKINYLDPRISVAWCKRNEVPIEKIFNKSLLAKFSWAMDVEPDYRF